VRQEVIDLKSLKFEIDHTLSHVNSVARQTYWSRNTTVLSMGLQLDTPVGERTTPNRRPVGGYRAIWAK
jgi:hypothetical protein